MTIQYDEQIEDNAVGRVSAGHRIAVLSAHTSPLATTMRSAVCAIVRSAAIRRSVSCSVMRARFFTSPRVWNIATCGTAQRSARRTPAEPDIQ